MSQEMYLALKVEDVSKPEFRALCQVIRNTADFDEYEFQQFPNGEGDLVATHDGYAGFLDLDSTRETSFLSEKIVYSIWKYLERFVPVRIEKNFPETAYKEDFDYDEKKYEELMRTGPEFFGIEPDDITIALGYHVAFESKENIKQITWTTRTVSIWHEPYKQEYTARLQIKRSQDRGNPPQLELQKVELVNIPLPETEAITKAVYEYFRSLPRAQPIQPGIPVICAEE